MAKVLIMAQETLKELLKKDIWGTISEVLDMGIHLGEGEDAGIRARTGMSSVEWCEAIDFVGPDVWFAHGWAFTDEEIARLAQSGTGLSHCPGPVYLVGEEITPIPAMYAEGMRISLGCDGAASNDNSNLAECIRDAYQLQCLVAKSHDYPVPSPYEFLRFGTQGGADCLNRSDIGTLEPAKAADFFAVDLNSIEYVGANHDPLSLPAKVGFSSSVDMTVINGKVVWKDGEFPGLDENQMAAEADATFLRVIYNNPRVKKLRDSVAHGN